MSPVAGTVVLHRFQSYLLQGIRANSERRDRS
jgi:hypothetical protein